MPQRWIQRTNILCLNKCYKFYLMLIFTTTCSLIIINLKYIHWNTTEDVDNSPHSSKLTLNFNATDCFKNLEGTIVVHTAPGNFDRRKAIRRTWGHRDILKKLNLKIIFIIGINLNSTIQYKLEQEIERKGDMVQLSSFVENYHNLTYKAIGWMTWISEHEVKNETIIVKVDDDVFVNTYALRRFLDLLSCNDEELYSTKILCHSWTNGFPIRDANHKWHISKEQYPNETFPEFCSGYGYILTKNAVKILLNVTSEVPVIWLDDVYVTGLLAQRTNVGHINCPSIFSYQWTNLDSLVKGREIIKLMENWEGFEVYYELWSKIEDSQRSLNLVNYHC